MSSVIAAETVKTSTAVATGTASYTDSGVSATDHITNATTTTLTITAEHGAKVEVFDNTGHIGWATETTTAGQFTYVASNLADGAHSFTAQATDIAGNTSAVSSVIAAETVDTNTLAATNLVESATVSTAHLDANGVAYINALANISGQTITGNIEAGSTVTLKEGSTTLGTTIADLSGAFTFTVDKLSDGLHTLTVTGVNVAGNALAASTVTVDVNTNTAAATNLVESAAVATAHTDTNGVAYINAVANTASQTIKGNVEAGSTVTITDGTKTLGTAVANGSGDFTITVGQLADGVHTLSVSAVDLAGNTLAPSTVTVDVNTLTPTASFVSATASNKVTTSVDAGTVSETFVVQFNEAITQKPLTTDFNAINGSVTSITDLGGNKYSVIVTPDSGVHSGGSLSLALSSTTTIVDAAGNHALNSAVITSASVGMDTYDVATLPGSVSNWTISTNPTTGGYDLVSTIDSTVFHLASTVQTLNFNGTGGGVVSSVSLGHTGGVAIIDDSSDTSTLASNHVFTIAAASTNATTVIMGQQGGVVVGANHTTATGSTDVTVDTVQINGSYANAVFTNNANGTVTITEQANGVTSTTIISNVQNVHFNDADVRIVGAGGYNSLSDATLNYTGTNPLNVYVTNSTLASGANGVIHNASTNVTLADQDTSSTSQAVMTIDPNLAIVHVNIYGTHSFNITANNNTDTIMDYTTIASGHINYITGGSGTDYLSANIASSINSSNGYDVIHGGSGTDTLIAGYHSQVYAGNGTDILLAEGAGAYLQGGAGHNILLNAYASTDTPSSANAVTLVGGTGANAFALIGDSYDATHGSTGALNTVIAGLHSTDTLDLGFLDNAVTGAAITSISSLSGGKVTQTTAGTTVNLSTFDLSTTDSTTTATHATAVSSGHLTAETGGTLLVQNASMVAVANAITGGTVNNHTASSIDFSSTFGNLTDTYNHH